MMIGQVGCDGDLMRSNEPNCLPISRGVNSRPPLSLILVAGERGHARTPFPHPRPHNRGHPTRRKRDLDDLRPPGLVRIAAADVVGCKSCCNNPLVVPSPGRKFRG